MAAKEKVIEILSNARVDLAGNVEGQFSPEDWDKILEIARARLEATDQDLTMAWIEVIRSFTKEKFWGFVPNYKKPKVSRKDQNLGKRFIWYCFRSFLITKVIVLYCGARYSADDPNPIYKWLFFGGIAFMLTSYGVFLWRYGRQMD
jgi:hypothetical protein